MKCEDARVLLSEYSRDELATKAAEELRVHLGGCAACTTEEAGQSALVNLLRNNPLEPPTSLSFSMMPNRVWEQLQAKRRRQRWYGLAGLLAGAAALALLLWPQPQVETPHLALPGISTSDRPPLAVLAAMEEALPTEEDGMAQIFVPEDLSDLDEESAGRLVQELSRALPAPEEPTPTLENDDGGYLDELDDLSPVELDRLNAILAAKKKG